MRALLRAILCCLIGDLIACELLAQSPSEAISGSAEFTLNSQELNREYRIRVEGAANANEKPRPTIYVLDGQWEFDLVSSIYGGLRQDGFVPDAMLVGICIQGTDEERRAIRSQDFAPSSANGQGKDVSFRKFLCETIVPEIERRFRCDREKRILTGWSMGGMFTVETLLSSPGSFRHYIAISPALFWDQGHALKRLQTSDFVEPIQPLSLALSVGEFEPPLFQKPLDEFAKAIEALKLSHLQLTVRSIEKERHFSSRAIAYGSALKSVFAPQRRVLSEAAMTAICGVYRPVDPQWGWWGDVEIGLSEGRLWAARKFSGFEGRDELVPISDTEFLGTRYGSRFDVTRDGKKTTIDLKWEEFPTFQLMSTGP